MRSGMTRNISLIVNGCIILSLHHARSAVDVTCLNQMRKTAWEIPHSPFVEFVFGRRESSSAREVISVNHRFNFGVGRLAVRNGRNKLLHSKIAIY